MWDLTTDFGQRVERRLADEVVVWLVTTSADGTPQPSPVWYIREGDTLLLFSKPDAPKVRNISARPRVAMHFNTDADGENVVVFLGTASLDAEAPPADQIPAYLDKYATAIAGLKATPEQFAATYSTAIRVTLSKVRGF